MRLNTTRLTQRLISVLSGEGRLAERLSLDRRVSKYIRIFGLRADSARLLDQLAQSNGRLVGYEDVFRANSRFGRVVDLRPRSPECCMVDIRERVGSDAIETVKDAGWRLTPLGRLRTQRARGVELKL